MASAAAPAMGSPPRPDRVPRPGARRPSRAQLISGAVLAAPVVLMLLVTAGTGRRLIYAGGTLAAVAVLRDGVRRHRPTVATG